jgi:hypothetical protein
MDTTSYDAPGRQLCGQDVGTGASCIYPLLGTRQRNWNFVATGNLPRIMSLGGMGSDTLLKISTARIWPMPKGTSSSMAWKTVSNS